MLKIVFIREPFRFLLNSSAASLFQDLNETLQWKPLESRPPQDHSAGGEGCSESGEPGVGVVPESLLFLPGAGMAKVIYKRRCVCVCMCVCVSVSVLNIYFFFLLFLLLNKKNCTKWMIYS